MEKRYLLNLFIAIIVIGVFFYAAKQYGASHDVLGSLPVGSTVAPEDSTSIASDENNSIEDLLGSKTQTTDHVTTEDIKVGTGAEAKTGDTVTVHYTGTLTDGTKFDSSRDRNAPLTFTIGKSAIIEGWQKGIPGMKVGGTRKLTIPPSLGYGSQGQGPIPPDATLLFDVELLKVEQGK